MEMINRLNGDALDSQRFVDRLRAGAEAEVANAHREAMLLGDGERYVHGGNTRAERRAAERAARKDAQRKAKARP